MRHVGMQEQISMSIIASVDGKCYDNARTRVERKLSGTEEVNSRVSGLTIRGTWSGIVV